MSETKKKTEEKTMEQLTESKATTKEMSRDEYFQAEHLVQTGQSETLVDGRKIKDVQKDLVELQNQQDAERAKRDQKWIDAAKDQSGVKTGEEFLNETVQVTGFANGVTSARSVPEETETPVLGTDPNAPLSDLPENFPGRKELIAGKVYSLEAVAKLDLDGLKAIDGIGKATAEAILAYGNTE
jgi:hypothetical protein